MINIPFGNSEYQIKTFTENLTPERKYRFCLLQIDQKERALKECQFRRKKIEIDIEEINETILSNTNKFEVKKLKIDLEEKLFNLDCEIKLIEDAIIEIQIYKKMIEGMSFTREEFENSEQIYWKKRLINDARKELLSTGTISVGTITSLEQVGVQIKRNGNYIEITMEDNNGNLLPKTDSN